MSGAAKLPTVLRSPGWWKVTDHVGDPAYFEFREDGRARLVRGREWDWCYVQGTWEQVWSPEFLRWANADPKPTAVVGDVGYMARRREDARARKAAGWDR